MTVSQTKSGIFVREAPEIGLLTYNPFTGLFYACSNKHKDCLLDWLNQKCSEPPATIYRNTLGVGWAVPDEQAEDPIPHLLPTANEWPTLLPSSKPILINWLITGNCALNCRYCYAQDVMHGRYAEPTEDTIRRTVDSILFYDPIAVVLTGGDPLVSPYLELAIRLLSGKAGIIVDTSAYTLQSQHVQLFQQYGVFLRISLDSEIPKINNYLRPVQGKAKRPAGTPLGSVEAAVNAIATSVDAQLKVAVQTVVTKKNQSDLEALGSKLFRMGVKGWRLLMVAPCKANIQTYAKLTGNATTQKRYSTHIVRQLISKQKNIWHNKMSVQFASNEIPNDIILVAPDGTFLTESNVNAPNSGKVTIDPMQPQRPSYENIKNFIDMHAHTARYLNKYK